MRRIARGAPVADGRDGAAAACRRAALLFAAPPTPRTSARPKTRCSAARAPTSHRRAPATCPAPRPPTPRPPRRGRRRAAGARRLPASRRRRPRLRPLQPPRPRGPSRPPPQTPTRDEALLGDPGRRTAAQRRRRARESAHDRRPALSARAEHRAGRTPYPDKWTLASPNLLDAYFDARPNERVRAFIRGAHELRSDARRPAGTIDAGRRQPDHARRAARSPAASATGFSTFNASRGPNTVLDQMWIAFDIEHKVFVTAGKQHVKWGTGRFWTPTDYLHPIKRNPLDVFDARPGTSMLKLHFPWESRAWNFYGFARVRGSERRHQHPGPGRGRGARRDRRRARRAGPRLLREARTEGARRRRLLVRHRRLRSVRRHRHPRRQRLPDRDASIPAPCTAPTDLDHASTTSRPPAA